MLHLKLVTPKWNNQLNKRKQKTKQKNISVLFSINFFLVL